MVDCRSREAVEATLNQVERFIISTSVHEFLSSAYVPLFKAAQAISNHIRRFMNDRFLNENDTAATDSDTYEALLEKLIDTHRVALAIFDTRGRCTFTNRGAPSLLGLPVGDMIGKNARDLADGGNPYGIAFHEGLTVVCQKGARFYREFTFNHGEEELRLLGGFIPQHGHTAGSDSILAILVDLSGSNIYGDSRREAEEHRNNLLAALSHELRNPLATLSSGLKILALSPLSDQADRARLTMERQLLHVVRLVNDILDMSRINQGTLQLTRSYSSINDIVTLAIEASEPSIQQGQHAVTVSLPQEPLTVWGDINRLVQVLTNLLDNASKYTPNGGKIALRVFVRDASVVFEVSDNGVGIPPDKQHDIFQAYSQISESKTRSRGGLGIGLYLVKSIMEAHGGNIEVESAGPTRGSVFRAVLPQPESTQRPDVAVARLSL
jgi:signal transduction histidine kinase